jgi:hypothetical protein
MEPRSDGLVWPCSYFGTDGTHPATGARNLVADSLLAFFKRDATTVPWFVSTVTAVAEQSVDGRYGRIIRVFPIPASRFLNVEAASPPGVRASIHLYSVSGRLVWSGGLERSAAVSSAIRIDVARLPSGVYYLQYRDERGHRDHSARRIVIAR